MIVNRKRWDQILERKVTLVPEGLPPLRGDPRLLFSFPPPNLPGWLIFVSSTHHWKKTIQHLLLKRILFTLSKPEKQISRILIGERNSTFLYHFWKLLEEEKFPKKSEENELFLHRCSVLYPDFLPMDYWRFLKSFDPGLIPTKVWIEKTKLPPKRYIGVGYNDQGHLSDSPSWQSQVLWNEDDLPTNMDSLKLLRTHH